MKELSIEEKAKRFDEAIKIAKSKIKNDKDHVLYEDDVLEIFPELKESEDEKIRKQIIGFITYSKILDETKKNWLSWLEKQESCYTFEIKEGHWYKCVCDYMPNGSDLMFKNDRLYYCRSDWRLAGEIDERNVKDIGVKGYKSFFRPATNQEIKDWLEGKTSQKPTDKVESKFEVEKDKWYICISQYCNCIEGRVYKATSDSRIMDDFGTEYDMQSDAYKYFRLWTIQDVKDGDVLACGNDIVIFKENNYNPKDKSGCMFVYCSCNNFYEIGGINPTDYKPATKEQRDLLFQKMKEAGYEWDTEKKELKKIIVPIFNIGDTIAKKHNSDIHNFGSFVITDITSGKYWYNDRIICDITEQDEWELYEPVRQNSTAWSEEDETNINYVIQCIERLYDKQEKIYLKESLQRKIDWLKSLKDRIQPKQEWSEEDIVAIDCAVDVLSRDLPSLAASIERLKSLRPQNWTKEDKERYISCLQRLGTGNPEQPETINSKWFKEHVYPQSTWKPSNQELAAMLTAIADEKQKGSDVAKELRNIYQQLKKLVEE